MVHKGNDDLYWYKVYLTLNFESIAPHEVLHAKEEGITGHIVSRLSFQPFSSVWR